MSKEIPTSYDEMQPGRFLKAGLLKGKPCILTITNVYLDELDGKDKPKRGIISFRETERELVINATNGAVLKAMFGAKPADMITKRIQVSPERDRLGPKIVDCLRITGSKDIEQSGSVTINKQPPAKSVTRKYIKIA